MKSRLGRSMVSLYHTNARSEVGDKFYILYITSEMPSPRRSTRTTAVEEDELPPMKVVPISKKEAFSTSPRDENHIAQIIRLHPPTPGRKTSKVTYSKLVAVPDVSECAHAAQVAMPPKNTEHADGENASECARTPTGSPRRTLAERGPLPADALALLDGIDLKSSVKKDVERPEARKLLALAEAIDAAYAQFADDDQSRWPTNETIAMLLLDFAEISANNCQHQLARDVTMAMREGCVDSLRGALKLLSVHVRATRSGLLSDSPRKRSIAKITERQLNALKRWNYDPQSDGFGSFESMTVAEAGVALDALISQSQARKKAKMAADADVITVE